MRIRFALAAGLLSSASGAIIQGTVLEAGSNAPLAWVQVSNDSLHSTFTGRMGNSF